MWSPWLSPKWFPIVKNRTLVPVIRSPPYSGIRSVIPSQVAESHRYNGQSRHTCQVLRFRRSHYGFLDKLKTTAVVRNDYGFTLISGCNFLVVPGNHLIMFGLFLDELMGLSQYRWPTNIVRLYSRALKLLRSGNYSLFALRSYAHEGKPRGSIMSAPPAKNVRFDVCSNIKSSWLSYININA